MPNLPDLFGPLIPGGRAESRSGPATGKGGLRCPRCGAADTQVKDSRPSEDGGAIRRRRSCAECGARFTTYERIQSRELYVRKSDTSLQPFDRDKLYRSFRIALRKRPVEQSQIDEAVDRIARYLEAGTETEIAARTIGQLVMRELAVMDQVALVRYASVHLEFKEIAEFGEFVARINEAVAKHRAEQEETRRRGDPPMAPAPQPHDDPAHALDRREP